MDTFVKKNRNNLPLVEKEEQYHGIFEASNDGFIIYDWSTGLVVEANPAAYAMHGCTRREFIGQPLVTYIHNDSQYAINEQLKAFQSGDVFDARTLHLRRDGTTFIAEWRGTDCIYFEQPCLLVAVRDVSKRIDLEQLLHRRVEIRTHEQKTLLEISHTLASTLELQPGLILDQLREIIEYNHAGLFALEDTTLVTLAMRGTPIFEKSKSIRIHLQESESISTLFNEHQPIRIAEVWSDNPQALFLRSLLQDGADGLITGMQSWMWVPLVVKNRIIGGLGVAHEKRNHFTAHHADLALSVANQAAITMINAKLYEHAQSMAVLEERQRLARNLHDAVNQSLFSAGLIAEVLPRLWEKDQAQARISLEDLRRLTRGAMAEMRALLAELRPSTLTDAELGDLLRLLGNAFTGRTNIPAQVNVLGQGVLPAEVQVAIYRICQEALNNVAKHAGACRLEIDLKYEDDTIELSIRDDGRGFDPKKTASGHYGLGMMYERADSVGAILSILSQPGQGTALTIHWKESGRNEVI
jgi:PAS domain S-box-containing protein